jgi:hypothetical protein
VDAWVELAELVASEDFRRRARAMVLAGQDARASQARAPARSSTRPSSSRPARPRRRGSPPGSPEGKAVLDRIVAPGTPVAQRARMLARLETFTDARVERYWQLLAVINGQPAPPSVVPDLGQGS